jgi:hypothetical protein
MYLYFLFSIAGAWGIGTRPAIRFDEEYLSFPIIDIYNEQKNELISLVNDFLSPYKKFHSEFNLGQPEKNDVILHEINAIINHAYNLVDYEKDLIDYVLNISRYQFQESKQHLFTRKVDTDKDFLENYARVFIAEFSKIYDDEYIQVEVYPLNYFIALNFIFTNTEPDEKIIYPSKSDESEVLKRLADNLSIEQITNTENPSKNLFVQKDIKGFEYNSFYIIKPNEFKCWHRSMAWYDVAEFKNKIEEAELNNLNNSADEI